MSPTINARLWFDSRLRHNQGRSQIFWFGGATGVASFATRGAVNGLCLIALNNFNAVAWRHAENFGGARQNFGGAVASPGTPLAPPKGHNAFRKPGLRTLVLYHFIVASQLEGNPGFTVHAECYIAHAFGAAIKLTQCCYQGYAAGGWTRRRPWTTKACSGPSKEWNYKKCIYQSLVTRPGVQNFLWMLAARRNFEQALPYSIHLHKAVVLKLFCTLTPN